MTTDIIKGVAARIYEIEGGRATIYTGEVPQGYEPPCFFIEVLNATTELIVGRRYLETVNLNVSYFAPERDDGTVDHMNLEETGERLRCALEYIHAGGNLTRGTDISSAEGDGAIHVAVTYAVHTLVPREEIPLMKTLKQTPGVKEGG